MKAISLWQPWASLWLSPFKVNETRHWATSHRGWLAVHAAKHVEKDLEPELIAICEKEFGASWRSTLPYGAIIGAVYLEDCSRMDKVSPAHQDDETCGNWHPSRYAWRRGETHVRLITPARLRGHQRLFDIPDAIVPSLPIIGGAAPDRPVCPDCNRPRRLRFKPFEEGDCTCLDADGLPRRGA